MSGAIRGRRAADLGSDISGFLVMSLLLGYLTPIVRHVAAACTPESPPGVRCDAGAGRGQSTETSP
ncbi:hypothetical protein H483_0105940 [Dietzia sp. UCD-THP]|nr:hypothetical protein H483_0105940 [Dietzia sp. UCD-THP]